MLGITFRTIFLAAAVIFSSHVLAADGLPTQTTNQSAVTVKVTPRNLQGEVWEFDVVFDTHSQALNDDLTKEAVLVATDGTKVSPVDWKGDPAGGHHRKGVLRFNALKPAPATVTLLISRPGEPQPRSFLWDLK